MAHKSAIKRNAFTKKTCFIRNSLFLVSNNYLVSQWYKNRFSMKDAGLEPMAIPAICRKVKLSKLKKNKYQQLSRRKSMASFKEAVLNLSIFIYYLKLIFITVHVAPNLSQQIFFPHVLNRNWSAFLSHFLVYCVEYLYSGWKSHKSLLMIFYFYW